MMPKGKKKMKRFLIPKTLLLIILLTAFGCGNSDNILAPESNTGNDVTLLSNDDAEVLAKIKSEAAVFTAPKNGKENSGGKSFQNHWVNHDTLDELGGQLSCGPCKLIIPPGALSGPTGLYMSATTDGVQTIDYTFHPHGLQFLIPATLQMSWSVLKGVSADDLVLHYWDESLGEWVIETRGVWDTKRKRVLIEINHFSLYYFRRR